MTSKTTVDAARVELLLNELRLPGIKLMWARLAEQSDKEAGRRPALPVGLLGELGPRQLDAGQAQLVEQQFDAGGIHGGFAGHAATSMPCVSDTTKQEIGATV